MKSVRKVKGRNTTMPKTGKVLLVIAFSTLIVAFFFPPIVVISLLAVVIFLVYLIVRRLTMSEEALQKNREEVDAQVAKWNARADEARKKQEQGRAELEKLRASERARKADDRRAVSAVLISTDNKKSAIGSVGRAAIGGTLFGPVGAIAGAASGTSKARKATFSVKYASGRTATETVPIGSKRFNELSALLHK